MIPSLIPTYSLLASVRHVHASIINGRCGAGNSEHLQTELHHIEATVARTTDRIEYAHKPQPYRISRQVPLAS